MKKTLVLLVILFSFSTFAHAQAAGDDTTAQELSDLRKKLSRVQREMSLLMKDVISNASAMSDAALSNYGNDIYVDILQTDKTVIVRADLPGMEKDKINVTLDNDKFLKISGNREFMKSEKSPGVVRQERFSGSFSKIVELPCEVTPAGINAVYKDGVLEIIIPKKAKSPGEETVKIHVN